MIKSGKAQRIQCPKEEDDTRTHSELSEYTTHKINDHINRFNLVVDSVFVICASEETSTPDQKR